MHPEVSKFLSDQPLSFFIGGEWIQAVDGGTFKTRDPGTNRLLAMVAAGGDHDIDRAVKAANDAFRNSSWANLPSNDRAVFLHRLADLVDQRRDILAQLESLDVGKPLSAALAVERPVRLSF
jgi:acyl-CoA reductase-like NAD-dependent aldehyde dehydrogenase